MIIGKAFNLWYQDLSPWFVPIAWGGNKCARHHLGRHQWKWRHQVGAQALNINIHVLRFDPLHLLKARIARVKIDWQPSEVKILCCAKEKGRLWIAGAKVVSSMGANIITNPAFSHIKERMRSLSKIFLSGMAGRSWLRCPSLIPRWWLRGNCEHWSWVWRTSGRQGGILSGCSFYGCKIRSFSDFAFEILHSCCFSP